MWKTAHKHLHSTTNKINKSFLTKEFGKARNLFAKFGVGQRVSSKSRKLVPDHIDDDVSIEAFVPVHDLDGGQDIVDFELGTNVAFLKHFTDDLDREAVPKMLAFGQACHILSLKSVQKRLFICKGQKYGARKFVQKSLVSKKSKF